MCIEHLLFYIRSVHQKYLTHKSWQLSGYEIFGSLTSLRSLPVDVLSRNFDVASLAVDTAVIYPRLTLIRKNNVMELLTFAR